MSIHDIVENLTQSNTLFRLISSYRLSEYPDEDKELKKDLASEIILILLTYKDPDRLVEMQKRGELEYFVLRIIKNQVYSRRTRYWKQYGRWTQNRSEFDESLVPPIT